MGLEAQCPGSLGGGGRGEKADAEVKVAADPQAAAPERRHAPAHVLGDLAPGGIVGGDRRVRGAARLLEPRSIGLEDRVPGAIGALEPDPGPLVEQVDAVGVVAGD